MPNTILTPKIIAQEALMVLESQLTMAGLVHRDYSKEFVRVGDTITIRKPAKFVAKNFVGETHGQDITEGSTTVKMDRFRDVTVNVSSKELTLDIKDFSEQVVTPAISAIAQAVDQDLLAVGIEKAAKTATVSAKPALTDIAGVGKALDMSKAPIQNRRLILPAEIKYKYNTLDNFAKQCYAGDSQALRDAEVGRVYTCDTFSSENCPHSAAEKPGTVTGYKVTGAKDTTEFTVSAGEPATGKIAEGDQLIVNGNGLTSNYIVNPHYTEANFEMIIYGPVINPQVTMGTNTYLVNIVLEEGEYLQISSRDRTIVKVLRNGERANAYHYRQKGREFFQKIQPGRQMIQWTGKFNFDLTVYEERSEPKWNVHQAH